MSRITVKTRTKPDILLIKKTVKLEKPSWCHMSIPVSYFGNLFWYSRRRLCCVLRVITLLQKLPAHNNRH